MKEKVKKGVSPYKVRRALVKLCWGVAVCSLIFGVYKNFTAVDKVTVKETETVIEKVENYAGLEAFTENFAKIYFAYSPDTAQQTERKELLKSYMQSSLVDVNSGNTYAETEITVQSVQTWGVDQVSGMEHDYEVLFTVVLKNGEQAELNAYTMDVHCEDQAYVVVKNPTVTSVPQISEYEREPLQISDQVRAEDRERVGTFLETFYKIYPTASEKELAYYCKDQDIRPIGKPYVLNSIDNIMIQVKESGYEVECYVSYIDEKFGMQVLNQYQLSLVPQESGELIIEEMR